MSGVKPTKETGTKFCTCFYNTYEMLYNISAVIEYLKEHDGYNYKVYNRLCPGIGEPDSNIVEYAEDVEYLINKLLESKND